MTNLSRFLGLLALFTVLISCKERTPKKEITKKPNVIIVITFNNIDEQLDWGSVGDLFPDVKMADISTSGLSLNTATIFLRNLGNHVQGSDVVPSEDFKYVRVIYHNVKNTGVSLKFEEEKWKPMIQKAMNDGTTTMKGWGNARIIYPSSSKFPYTISTHDLFSSLTDVLSPNRSEPLPDGFFKDLSGNSNGLRSRAIYRIEYGE